MGAPAPLDWLFALIGLSVVGGGLLLLLWALFSDRARARRRCPKCWYDMAGVPGLRCPECGREAKSEVRLHRTRRRWRPAAIAALGILAGLACDRWPHYTRGGWINAIPSWALIWLAPAKAPSAGFLGQVGAKTWTVASAPVRGSAPTLSQAPSVDTSGPNIVFSYSAVNTGSMTLTPVPPPPGEPLASRLYRAAWSRIADGDMAGWEASLYLGRCLRADPALSPRAMLRVPRRWPADMLVPVDVAAELPSAFGIDVRFAGQPWETVVNPSVTGLALTGHFSRVLAGVKPAGVANPALEFRITAGGRAVYESSIPTNLEQRGTVDTFLDAVDSPEATAQVAAALRPKLVLWYGRPVVEFSVRSELPPWRAIDYGVLFTADLVIDGRVLGWGDGQADWETPRWGGADHIYLKALGGQALMKLEDGGVELTPELLASRGATLVIKGDRRTATQFYLARPFEPPTPRYWAGTITIPLTNIEVRGRGPESDPPP